MIETRPITRADAPACVEILNHIIALGGSTAYEAPFTETEFAGEYVDDPAVCMVALVEGRAIGFQAVFDAGEGLYSIGSFTDRRAPVKGAGRALFAATLAACRARGGVAILARITADNALGLSYYSAIGFADWQMWPDDHTRADGTKVDRVVKRYNL